MDASLRIKVDATSLAGARDELGRFVGAGRDAERQLTGSADRIGRSFSGLKSALGASLGGIGVAAIVTQLAKINDEYAGINARLQLVSKSNDELIRSQRELFEVAQRTGSQFASVASLYTRVARNADALGLSQAKLLQFTEATNQAMQVSGAATSEAAAGTQQLAQALASGVLRGDEFNSIMENTPRVAQAIADGLGLPVGALRALAEQGKLTADIVTQAILSQSAVINREFQSIPDTIGRALTRIENDLKRTVGSADMQPLVKSLNDLRDTLNDPAVVKGITTISTSITTLAGWAIKAAAGIGSLVTEAAEVAAFLSLDSASRSMIRTAEAAERVGAAVAAPLAEIERLSGVTATAFDTLPNYVEQNVVVPFRRAGDAAARLGSQTDEALAKANQAATQNLAVMRRVFELTQQGVAADIAAYQAKAEADGINRKTIESTIALMKATKAYQDAQTAATDAARKYREEQERIAEALRKFRDEQEKRADALDNELGSVRDQVAQQQRLNELLNQGLSIGDAKARVAIEFAEIQSNELNTMRELLNAEQARTDAIVAGRDAVAERAKRIVEEHRRAADEINRLLTDSILRGFESGKSFAENFRDTLRNMFSTLVLRPIIEPLVAPVSIAIQSGLSQIASTAGGTAIGGAAGGAIGGAGSGLIAGGLMAGGGVGASALAGGGAALGGGGFMVGSTVYGANGAMVGSGFGAQAGFVGGAALGAGLIGYGVGSLLEGHSYFGNGTAEKVGGGAAAGAAIGSVIPGVGTVIGGIAGAVVGGLSAAITGRWTTKAKELSLIIADGLVDVTSIERQKKKRLGPDKSRTITEDLADADSLLSQQFGMVFEAVKVGSAQLGLSVGAFTFEVKESIKGLDPSELQDKIGEIFNTATDALVTQVIPGIEAYQAENEKLSQTFVRVVNETAAVRDALDTIAGSTRIAAGLIGVDLAQSLVDAAGGAQALLSNLSSFQQGFLSESERNASLAAKVQAELAKLGQTMPQTREQFAALVRSIEVTDDASAELYTGLIALSPALATLFDATDKAALDAANAAQQMQEAADRFAAAILSTRDGILRAMVGLQGGSVARFDVLALSRQVLKATTADGLLALIGPLQQALEGQFNEAVQNVTDTTNASVQALEARRSALEDEMATYERLQGMARDLRDYVRGIRLNDAFNPSQQLIANQQELFRTANLARTGNEDAVRNLPAIADRVLSVGANALRTREDFARLQASVSRVVGGVAGALEQTKSPEQAIASIDKQIADLNASALQQIETLKAGFGSQLAVLLSAVDRIDRLGNGATSADIAAVGLAIVGGVVPPLSTVNGSVNGLQAPLIDLSGGIDGTTQAVAGLEQPIADVSLSILSTTAILRANTNATLSIVSTLLGTSAQIISAINGTDPIAAINASIKSSGDALNIINNSIQSGTGATRNVRDGVDLVNASTLAGTQAINTVRASSDAVRTTLLTGNGINDRVREGVFGAVASIDLVKSASDLVAANVRGGNALLDQVRSGVFGNTASIDLVRAAADLTTGSVRAGTSSLFGGLEDVRGSTDTVGDRVRLGNERLGTIRMATTDVVRNVGDSNGFLDRIRFGVLNTVGALGDVDRSTDSVADRVRIANERLGAVRIATSDVGRGVNGSNALLDGVRFGVANTVSGIGQVRSATDGVTDRVRISNERLGTLRLATVGVSQTVRNTTDAVQATTTGVYAIKQATDINTDATRIGNTLTDRVKAEIGGTTSAVDAVRGSTQQVRSTVSTGNSYLDLLSGITNQAADYQEATAGYTRTSNINEAQMAQLLASVQTLTQASLIQLQFVAFKSLKDAQQQVLNSENISRSNLASLTADTQARIYTTVANSPTTIITDYPGRSEADLENRLASIIGVPVGNVQSLSRNDVTDILNYMAVPAFAKGGAFTNGVVDQPTMFNMGLMGEAGPEAIMPLQRMGDGSLGVRAQMQSYNAPTAQSADSEALAEELRQLRAEMKAALFAIAKSTGRTSDYLRRWDNGDGMNVHITQDADEAIDVRAVA